MKAKYDFGEPSKESKNKQQKFKKSGTLKKKRKFSSSESEHTE